MIRCEQLKKKFRRSTVLSNVSLQITEPKIMALIGRNGTGKSTLLRLIAGHLKPTAGKIEVLGENPFNSLQVASNTVLIEESLTFPSPFTLADILKQGATFYPNWQQDLAEKLLAYANIPLHAYHEQLSTGQRATFNLVYGLATRSKITLLDEPMNGMDEAIRTDFYRAILKEYITYPRLIIISSHYLSEMEHLIEEILCIHRGVVELHAPLDEIQTFAVRLRGDQAQIAPFIEHLEVLHAYDEAPFYEVVVPAAQLNVEALQAKGVFVLNVSASEVCQLITSEKKEGIDRVFK
ncbi:ABC transporter ATP-binding protein [Lysinibacillus sp. KU-BSD001]|uniref:ATP-binding cassette domain-containing protein n=1 Tax=Lysinibacillus sp. KU-BSD001 TaxID=3141328 RepID=UPI0036EE767C